MKFQKHISQEVREFLTQQLKEYEQTTKMTKEERRLLHEWVASGHSPYENGDYIYGAGGPIDFVGALRASKEIEEWFNSLSEEERAEECSGCIQYNLETDDVIFDVGAVHVLDDPNEDLPFS